MRRPRLILAKDRTVIMEERFNHKGRRSPTLLPNRAREARAMGESSVQTATRFSFAACSRWQTQSRDWGETAPRPFLIFPLVHPEQAGGNRVRADRSSPHRGRATTNK